MSRQHEAGGLLLTSFQTCALDVIQRLGGKLLVSGCVTVSLHRKRPAHEVHGLAGCICGALSRRKP